jgi:hypothetical protein
MRWNVLSMIAGSLGLCGAVQAALISATIDGCLCGRSRHELDKGGDR